MEFNDDEPEYIQAYRWMCANRGMAMGEGRRVNLCRFGGLPHAIVNHVDQWDMDSFERSWVSLELDRHVGKPETLDAYCSH